MEQIKQIVEGHVNMLLGNKEALAEPRLKICQKCPLYKKTKRGYICNSNAWLNPKTGDFSLEEKDGYVKGCNCTLNAKTRVASAKCPAGKW